MNNEVFDKNWKQIRARSKVWWSLFSEADLEKVEKASIKRDKYAMMLRVKYGYTHERAREEINRRITDLGAAPSSDEVVRDPPSQRDGSKVSRVRKGRKKTPKSLSDDNISFE